MQFICHHCGNAIPDEKVNLEKRYATCPTCHAVYTLSNNDELMPMGVTVEADGNGLLIKRKWLSCIGYALIAFALIWNLVLFACTATLLGGINSPTLIFITPFLLGGIIAIYVGLAYSLNTTTIRVDREAITVEHKPILFLNASSRVGLGDVQQLSTRKHMVRGARSTSVMYQVWAISVDGKETKVIDRLEQPEAALFIEKEIERYLGIHNRPIDGEYQLGQ